MSFNNAQIIQRFKDGKTTGKSNTLFIEYNTMYSYGHHFPLLLRLPWGILLNADKYSSTTSRHQSLASHIATIQIPFSVLRRADIIPDQTDLVSKQGEVWETTCYEETYKGVAPRKIISRAQYKQLSNTEKEYFLPITERRPESAVIRYNNQYFLSSMDGGGRSSRYFLSQLPQPIQTVQEAFDSLVPTQAKGQYYQRQGEWFFVPARRIPMTIAISGKELDQHHTNRRLWRAMDKAVVLPKQHPDNHSHTATRAMQANGITLVSGIIRHSEHGLLKLNKANNPMIWEAYRNTAVTSYSTTGRMVD